MQYEPGFSHFKVHLLFVLVFLFSLSDYQAQIPGDEFLDHSDVETKLTGAILIGDELIYTMVNDRFAKTSVRIIKSDGSVADLLDEPLPYRSKTLMHKNPDGSVRILLYHLTKYEIGAGNTDIYDITYIDGHTVVNKITDVEWMISLETINSIAVDSTGDIYAIASNRLNRIEGQSVVELSELSQGGQLFSNSEGVVFFIDDAGHTIYQLLDMEPVEKISLPDVVLEHKLIGNRNFLLFEDRILIYDLDFDFLLAEFLPPVPVESLNQVQETEIGFVILDRKQDGFELIEVDFDFNSEIIYSSLEDLVPSQSLVFVSDEFFITSGSFRVEEITSQLFFRKFSYSEPFQPTRVDISLSDFTIEYLKDSTVFGAPPLYIYNAQYRLNNHGVVPPEKILVFSSRYLSSTSNSAYYKGDHHHIFQNEDEYHTDLRVIVPYAHPDPLRAAIPGADNKFNISEQAITTVEIASSIVEDISDDDQLLVFPNPASSKLNLDLNLPVEEVRVYDISGRQVLVIPEVAGLELDISGLSSGQYFLSLKSEGRHLRGSFVVQ